MVTKIVIIVNTLKNNRGTEAIVRGLETIIHSKLANAEIYVAANDVETEHLKPLHGIAKNIRKSTFTRKNYVRGAIYLFLKKILKSKLLAARFRYSKLLRISESADYILAIGADNYDKSYGMFDNLHELHTLLNSYCKGKLYLCDCSVSERDITPKLIEDFLLFEKITVRETTTHRTLEELSERFNVSYFTDPAFAMNPEVVNLHEQWQDGKMVGINLSNVVLSKTYGGDANIVVDAYIKLIDFVWEKELVPVLIPHVMGGADLNAMRKIFERCVDRGPIIMLDEKYNAAELKYVISKCSLFLGARTHATIAAYSSCVPTLVVGYSVKSTGIARDLFGTEVNYVLPVDKIQIDTQLVDSFKWIYDNKEDIRKKLEYRMPKYIDSAYKFNSLL